MDACGCKAVVHAARSPSTHPSKPMSSQCPTCRGRGTIRILSAEPEPPQIVPCTRCRGTGHNEPATPSPMQNGSTSGGTRASAAVKPRSPAYARPNATEPARGSGPAASFLALASNATASGLGRHLYAPSVLRRRHSGRLSHRSWLALPVLVMVRTCAWGRGQAAAVWRSKGGN